MVLSLEELCHRSIMIGVENGTIGDLFGVPSTSYQRLSELVLARRKIDNPIWIRLLSCERFLGGFKSYDIENGKKAYDEYLSSFNTQRGKINDSDYLHAVARSLESKLRNDATIGSRVERLYLNLYLKNGFRLEVFNLDAVVHLIAQCSNLRLLNIRAKFIRDEGQPTSFYSGLLNRSEQTERCRAVVENLSRLAFVGSCRVRVLIADAAPLKFVKLRSIRMNDCSLDGGRWRQLLASIRETLTHVNLINVNIGSASLADTYLPISLPLLESIQLGGIDIRCTMAFVANLRQCPNLRDVYFYLFAYSNMGQRFVQDQKNLKALCSLNADVEVKIRLCNSETDADSRFELVSIFGDQISQLNLNFHQFESNLVWNRRTAAAFRNVVDRCPNLTSLTFYARHDYETPVDRYETNSALARLLGDRNRFSKLRELELVGEIDAEILSIMFENRTNLDSLEIRDNRQLADSHLTRWARDGAKLRSLKFDRCDNLGDDGLIPILIKSGTRLTDFAIGEQMTGVGDGTWRVLIDHCQNVEHVGGMPDDLKVLAQSKCFDVEFE